MLVAKRENGEKVLATSELENTKDFICRFCGREVILKKGKIKSPHFAHKEKCECDYDEIQKEKCGGESEIHYKWKNKIKREMEQLSYVDEVLLEERIGNRIADIVVVFNNKIKDSIDNYGNEKIIETKRLIIEIQLSKVSLDKLVERSDDYMLQGYYDENIHWLLGERYMSTMGRCVRYISKDLKHFELFNMNGEDEREESVVYKDSEYEGEEWDIFTGGDGGIVTPSTFKQEAEIRTLQKSLKLVNKFRRKYLKEKTVENTFSSLCKLMDDGISHKRYEEYEELNICRREYVKQRESYSKKYGVSYKEIDGLVKEILDCPAWLTNNSSYYFTEKGKVYGYWFCIYESDTEEKLESIKKEKDGILNISQCLERIDAIENKDKCRYIVDKQLII